MIRAHIRLAVTAAVVLTAATAAAGFAFARTGTTTPVGTGVVVIDTNLRYQGGRAAGTGMVLSSSGEILTNNHVIRGATTIRVVVPGSGRSYTAKVVGYAVTQDIAVLRASGATNLKTVSLGTSTGLKLGQKVKAVGNAGGTGSLVTSTGRITGLSRTITVNDESGGTATLRNLIETDADLQPGDSGGPLLDAAGKVVGMNAAASVNGGFRFENVSSSNGYAIPINRAVAIVKLIVSGKASATIHVGSTAFLGISAVSTDDLPRYGYPQAGAVVASVVSGGPADKAGLVPGDVITAIDGKRVASSSAVRRIVLAKKPGTTVTITYLDANRTSRTTHATLVAGPPQ